MTDVVNVVSGQLSQGRDWSQLWLESPEHNDMIQELDSIIEEAAAKPQAVTGDGREFACTLWEQTVLERGRY
ncbi:ABC multidrug transporter [Penicillium bovifimosum]|uniref:ABC multidrug transporter n=1 Tax=Penicillium bovifimosum TaxID=126998 RepID=A0A9W9KWB0_9EURO|nr:ABC multidrug transporter [Penicillium bovifimosum]KAJ5124539.1 ABC multidrug transporter [Penicillium bovifimosum]